LAPRCALTPPFCVQITRQSDNPFPLYGNCHTKTKRRRKKKKKQEKKTKKLSQFLKAYILETPGAI